MNLKINKKKCTHLYYIFTISFLLLQKYILKLDLKLNESLLVPIKIYCCVYLTFIELTKLGKFN